MQTGEHRTGDGQSLATYRWTPEGDAKAVLQVVHGMAEHAARYAEMAEGFTRAGFVVHAHDHRGHGKSVRSPDELGDLGPWDRAVADVHHINQALHEEFPSLPLVVFGHSMGSFMVQQLLFEHPQDACAWILSGTDGKPPLIAKVGQLVTRLERMRLGAKRASSLLTKLSFGDFNKGFEGRTEYDWLSRDPAQVDLYVADPLCGFEVTTRTWVGLLDALQRISDPANQQRIPADTPVYLVAGGDDPVGQRGKGVRSLKVAYQKAGLIDVTVRLYPGARHEIVNETNRREVIDALVMWASSKI